MYRPSITTSPLLRKYRPSFRTSLTHYNLPSIHSVLDLSISPNLLRKYPDAYEEGRSYVLIWINAWDIVSELSLTPVTILDTTPMPTRSATPTTQSLSVPSNLCLYDGDLSENMYLFSSRSSEGAQTSQAASTPVTPMSSWCNRDNLLMRTIDLNHPAPSPESDTDSICIVERGCTTHSDQSFATEEKDEEGRRVFSSFMLHFPEDNEKEDEYEYQTVLYEDSQARTSFEVKVTSHRHTRNRNNDNGQKKKLDLDGNTKDFPSGVNQLSKKDRQITVILNSVKKMVSSLFKNQNPTDDAVHQEEYMLSGIPRPSTGRRGAELTRAFTL